MFKISTGALAVLALSLTGCATGYRSAEQPWSGYRTVEQPRAEYQTVEVPRQECWNEQVREQSPDSGYGGAILGGIAGGILGNQVGRGSGKTAATAAGAIVGAMVGDRISSDAAGYTTVQRCRTVIDPEQRPVALEPRQANRQFEPAEERDYNYRDEHRRHERWHEPNDDGQ